MSGDSGVGVSGKRGPSQNYWAMVINRALRPFSFADLRVGAGCYACMCPQSFSDMKRLLHSLAKSYQFQVLMQESSVKQVDSQCERFAPIFGRKIVAFNCKVLRITRSKNVKWQF